MWMQEQTTDHGHCFPAVPNPQGPLHCSHLLLPCIYVQETAHWEPHQRCTFGESFHVKGPRPTRQHKGIFPHSGGRGSRSSAVGWPARPHSQHEGGGLLPCLLIVHVPALAPAARQTGAALMASFDLRDLVKDRVQVQLGSESWGLGLQLRSWGRGGVHAPIVAGEGREAGG